MTDKAKLKESSAAMKRLALVIVTLALGCEPVGSTGGGNEDAIRALRATSEVVGLGMTAVHDSFKPGSQLAAPPCTNLTSQNMSLCALDYLSEVAYTWTDCTDSLGGSSSGSFTINNSFELDPASAACETATGRVWTGGIAYDTTGTSSTGASAERSGSVQISTTTPTVSASAPTAAAFSFSTTTQDTDAGGTVLQSASTSGSVDANWADPTAITVNASLMHTDTVAATSFAFEGDGLGFEEGCCWPTSGAASLTSGTTMYNITFLATCGKARLGILVIDLGACAPPTEQ